MRGHSGRGQGPGEDGGTRRQGSRPLGRKETEHWGSLPIREQTPCRRAQHIVGALWDRKDECMVTPTGRATQTRHN